MTCENRTKEQRFGVGGSIRTPSSCHANLAVAFYICHPRIIQTGIRLEMPCIRESSVIIIVKRYYVQRHHFCIVV